MCRARKSILTKNRDGSHGFTIGHQTQSSLLKQSQIKVSGPSDSGNRATYGGSRGELRTVSNEVTISGGVTSTTMPRKVFLICSNASMLLQDMLHENCIT